MILDCGIPLPPDNGDVLITNTEYGSECFFSCHPGYDLKGVNVSVCTEDGSWNNSQAECIIKGMVDQLFDFHFFCRFKDIHCSSKEP